MNREKAERALRLVVRADDPVTLEGAVARLAGSPEVDVLPAHRCEEADAVLVFPGEVTEETAGWIERAVARSPHEARPVVLVVDRISDVPLRKAALT
ncbi:hypothetical protein [Streptomyces sp. NPDC004658]|uniref:hypothetical protein n=1 Tax=Streptomyces sp. NPDC004658 TaxID=3154672 RepID=UPI0033BD074F